MAKYEIKDGVGIIPQGTKEIEEKAFFNEWDLISVVIPDSVKTIGLEAFAGSFGLKEIVIPESVTTIRRRAFEGCNGLTSIVLPSSLSDGDGNRAGGGVFAGCTYLKEVTINSDWLYDHLPDDYFDGPGIKAPFLNCTHLTTIHLSPTVKRLTGFTGCTGLKELVIPNTVERIGNYAFAGCTGLTSIVIPESVKEIGDHAFEDCTNITSIEIKGKALLKIGAQAFKSCHKLASINIPDSVQDLGNGAFAYCKELTNVVLPPKLKTLRAGGVFGLFMYCKKLQSIVIPDGVEEIPSSSFDGCSQLESVTIPESVKEIGLDAFKDCASLKEVKLPSSLTYLIGFKGCSSLKSVVLPKNLKTFGDSAFENCSSLSGIVLPDTLESIGNLAFFGCSSLSGIVVPATLTKIGNKAFTGCAGVSIADGHPKYDSRGGCNAIIDTEKNELVAGFSTSTIPEGVTKIGSDAFMGSTGLTSIDIPSTVTEIDYDAFKGCTGLKSIFIPKTVTEINRAFTCCPNLESIVVEDGNPNYDSREGCNAIIGKEYNSLEAACKNTIIPASVKSVESDAFTGSGVTAIFIPKTVTSNNSFSFEGCYDLTSIVVEEGHPKFDSREGCNAVIKTSDNKLIAGCKTTVIPASVTEIGWNAFKDTGITSIVIPETITLVDTSVFANCKFLKEVIISSPLKKIDEKTFENCTALETITLCAGIKKIDETAFKGCTAIKTINVPAKKGDYYRTRLPEALRDLVVELPAEKKAKK